MCARTTPAFASSGPNSRPARVTPSVDANSISRDVVPGPSTSDVLHAARTIASVATIGVGRTRVGAVTPARLPAELEPLVPGALQQLLVFLLAHLLPALLHEGRQRSMPFIRFRRGSGGRSASRGSFPPDERSPV